ncbi:E3 ubiquitin-protein ligase RLIM-like [Peromyscus eremicus]|uniref:E3 ubiquitin-protein ligase RLIM-like n=1 Tax=Peromyscus eremicus TaxID=42410 RepID=UPI0027DE22CD|nr:E3 ubiquitin-protein ligase RLIM-like [Peromyscus eremicus]
MLSCDIASYQSTTFQQYVVMEEEKRECQSWTGTSVSESQSHTFMEGDSVNDNYENPDLKYDHLYFARLLGEENMQNNERQVESEQSKSMFNSPHKSESNATDTLMAVPSTGSRTRKRCRSQQNWRKRPGMEREHMINNQKQMEHLQSESTFKKTVVSEEHKCEVLMLYNNSQKRTRRRGPGLPKANNWMRCETKTLDVVPQGNSERDYITTIQQSENRRKRFSYHDNNRNGQKQVHPQPESTCVIPFTPEEDTTGISMEDPFTRDRRNTRSESPEDLIVGEMTGSRPPQPIHQVALVNGHHRVSPETFPHLNMHEPLPSHRPVFPLNISELQRRHSFTSSPTRKYTVCTAHRGQSTSVTPANFINVEINKNEHTNIFSRSNQGGMQNSEISSVAQTSNTGLEFPLATIPYGTSGQILTPILEVEHDNCPEIILEPCDSSLSQNNRRVHSGESSISSFVSSSFSHSTSNSTISSLLSLSTPHQMFLQTLPVLETITARDENLPATFEINEDNNEPILFSHPSSEARQGTQVAGREESDDSDFWPFLPNFANFNDIQNNHPKGLTKEQINSLPIRAFCENDRLSICTICITEYTESSRIRILPCSHEYHDECIDNWLPEKSNCPICRRQIIYPPDDAEIPF